MPRSMPMTLSSSLPRTLPPGAARALSQRRARALRPRSRVARGRLLDAPDGSGQQRAARGGGAPHAGVRARDLSGERSPLRHESGEARRCQQGPPPRRAAPRHDDVNSDWCRANSADTISVTSSSPPLFPPQRSQVWSRAGPGTCRERFFGEAAPAWRLHPRATPLRPGARPRRGSPP